MVAYNASQFSKDVAFSVEEKGNFYPFRDGGFRLRLLVFGGEGFRVARQVEEQPRNVPSN